MISAEQEEIGVIDAQIFQLLSIISDLRSRRNKRTDRVVSLKMLISPIKELPNKIIARIFNQFAHGPYPDPDAYYRRTPWYLAHICSRWRAVEWATHDLCNFLIVRVGYSIFGNGDARSLEKEKYLLLRTGKSSISCMFLHKGPEWLSIKSFF